MTKEQIAEDLRRAILDEKFKEGQYLVEREFCEIYRVNRTPMQEVSWKLVLAEVVEQILSHVFFVSKLDWEQIFEIFQIREAIMGKTTRLAAQRTDSDFMSKLEEMMKNLETIDIQNNTTEDIKTGCNMHRMIMETMHNRFLCEFYEKVGYMAELTNNIVKKSTNIEEDSKIYHLSILQSILDGDADKSEMLIREHLRVTCRNIIQTFYPEVFSRDRMA